MKKNLSRILIGIMVLSLMLLSVACGSSNNDAKDSSASTAASGSVADAPKENVKIALIGGQPDWPADFDEILEKIKQDEGIEVDKQIVENWNDVIKVKLATSEVPEIVLGNLPAAIPMFNGTANFEVLDDQPWVSRLVNPGLVKYAKDGHIYGMPILQSSSFFGACYYNKKVMDELGISNPEPKTYAEFLAILDKIKNSGKDITPFYMSDKTSWTTQIFATLGMGVVAKDKPEVFDQIMSNQLKIADVPEFVELLTKFQNLYRDGYVNKNHMSATYDDAKEALGTGKAAMILQGEWVVADIISKYNTELGSFIIPFNDKMIMGSGAYVKGAFVTKSGDNVEAAKKWLNLLSQPKYMDGYYEKHPDFPAFNDLNGGNTYPVVKNLVDKYIATGNSTPEFNSYFNEVNSILEGYFWPELAILSLNKATPKEALEVLDRALQKAAKDKKLPGF